MKSGGNWWGWAANVKHQPEPHALCCPETPRRHYGDAFMNSGRWWIQRRLSSAFGPGWMVFSPHQFPAEGVFDTYAEAVAYVREQLT